MPAAMPLFLLVAAVLHAQAPRPAPTHADLVYATVDGRNLHLDLYLPGAAEVKPPLVVYVHGGAWRSGDKRQVPAAFLLERGFAVASVQYRLSQHAIFPAQIHDCKAAVRWLRMNSAKFGYDAARIGAWGPSAGGHLVALLGTSGGVVELEAAEGNGGASSTVQAVVDFFGPTDLPQMGKFPSEMNHDAPDSPESLLIGGPIQRNLDKAARANPIRYISPDDPPFLIVHGDKDPLVPLNQSELLHAALRRAGVASEFRVLPGAGHGGPQFNTPEMRDAVTAFLDKHLRKQ